MEYGWVKEVLLLLLWLVTLFFLVRNEIRKKDRYATSENFVALKNRVKVIEDGRGISPQDFAEHCRKCKKEWGVHDKEVRDDIKGIKSQLVAGDRLLTTLGVIQVAMCKHIDMPNEDVEMFKDAIHNGRDIEAK